MGYFTERITIDILVSMTITYCEWYQTIPLYTHNFFSVLGVLDLKKVLKFYYLQIQNLNF